MGNKIQSLKTLGDIAEIELEGKLAELARVAREEERLKTALDALEAEGRSAMLAKEQADQALVNLRNGAKWLRWRQERKNELNTRLANLMAEKEMVRSYARLAFGRVQAIKELADQEKRIARR